jgi:hypothetical protein
MEQSKIDLIGRVILRSSEIENALRARGGEGNGISELVGSLPTPPKPAVLKLLRYIALVRNQAAHEASGIDPETFDAAFFEEAAVTILAWLGNASGDEATGSVPAEPEVMTELSRRIRIAALIPAAHVVYPFWLLLRAFRPAAGAGIALLSYAVAGIMAAIAVKTAGTGWLWIAGAWTAAGWLYGAVTGFVNRKTEELPQLLYLMPVINILYLFYRAAVKSNRVIFFGALTLLFALVSGIFALFIYHEYLAGAIVLAAGYLVGAIMALVVR